MPVIDIVIEDEQWHAIDGVEQLVEQAGALALKRGGVAVLPGAEIAVLLRMMPRSAI